MTMTPNPPAPVRGGAALLGRAQYALNQLGGVTNQPSVRRAMPAIVTVIVTGIAIALWLFASEPARRPLFPGLAEGEKARVIEALASAGIDGQIDEFSGEVTVRKDDYYRARMALAEAGLPQDLPVGSDAIGDMPMGTSRSVESARLRQAQETDLARSIMEIADVVGARVHLALPEKSAFLRQNDPPRASVFLQLARGRVVAPGQVEAIVNLVSSSVPGMARQEVTVVDQAGNLLSRGGDDPNSVMNDRQLQQRLEVEKLYRQRIEALLTPLAGAGNLSVQVTTEMDFTRQEITAERVDPKGTALRSEQQQLSESSEALAKGIPGAVANTPPSETVLTPDPAQDGTAGGIMSRSTGATRNFEISRTVETTIPASAKVMRISAAVVIREVLTPAAEEGLPPISSVPAELLADMDRLVKSAIGFQEGRGDSVTVLARPFLDTVDGPQPGILEAPWLSDLVRQGGMIFALGIIAFGIVRPILLKVLFPGDPRELGAGMPDEAIEVQEGESLDQVRAKLKARQGALTKNMLDAAKSHEEQIVVIRKLVEEDAGRIATTFRQMISEELDTVS